ncbi:MAG: hypothetical protein QW362_04370 [Candidatus Caldarchaeum sp.]
MISYGAGALIVVALSSGILLVLSGAGAVQLEVDKALGVLLTIFGAYSILYGVSSKDLVYYAVWGGVSTAAGLALLTTPLVNPAVVIGAALIFIAAVGALAALRKQ